jgi:cytochrome c551/c552
MPDGYGVDPGQVSQAANQFRTEGEAIGQLAAKIEHPAVGAGQVGRHFQQVAEQYKGIFTLLNASVKSFGSASVQTSTQLSDVAQSYSGTEESNRQSMQGQG